MSDEIFPYDHIEQPSPAVEKAIRHYENTVVKLDYADALEVIKKHHRLMLEFEAAGYGNYTMTILHDGTLNIIGRLS